MGESTRICIKCGREFPETSEFFYVGGRNRDILRRECKICISEYGRARCAEKSVKNAIVVINLAGEEWLPVSRYEDLYEISNYGRVKRIKPGPGTFIGRLKSKQYHKQGYLYTNLCREGGSEHFLIHRMVAAAFIGPCPKGIEVNHKDGCKDNNFVDNLEYVTPKENSEHAAETGLLAPPLGEDNGNSKLTIADVLEIRSLARDGSIYQKDIADMYGVCTQTVNSIKLGKHWKWLKDE